MKRKQVKKVIEKLIGEILLDIVLEFNEKISVAENNVERVENALNKTFNGEQKSLFNDFKEQQRNLNEVILEREKYLLLLEKEQNIRNI